MAPAWHQHRHLLLEGEEEPCKSGVCCGLPDSLLAPAGGTVGGRSGVGRDLGEVTKAAITLTKTVGRTIPGCLGDGCEGRDGCEALTSLKVVVNPVSPTEFHMAPAGLQC